MKKISALVKKFFGKTKKAGDTYYGEKAASYHTKRIAVKKWKVEQSAVKEFLSEVPDGSTVLDVPFGTGRFVEMYLEKGMNIYGIDISADMLNAARKVLGDSFDRCHTAIGDATASLPYDDNFFDLAVCWRFLKFFPYKTAKHILSELHRVTKSKLILRMIVRKEDAPPVGDPKRVKKIGGIIYEKDLLQMIKQTGFKVLQKKLIHDGAEEEENEQAGRKKDNRSKVIYAFLLEKEGFR